MKGTLAEMCEVLTIYKPTGLVWRRVGLVVATEVVSKNLTGRYSYTKRFPVTNWLQNLELANPLEDAWGDLWM